MILPRDEFERVYDERLQPQQVYWRPVIRAAMDNFLPACAHRKCGDLREGFARVRCPDCGKEFFVAFSCKQRCCCPSCDQKRALLPGMRLTEEVFAPVGHRQWVLTMPKRLRLIFQPCGGAMRIIGFIPRSWLCLERTVTDESMRAVKRDSISHQESFATEAAL